MMSPKEHSTSSFRLDLSSNSPVTGLYTKAQSGIENDDIVGLYFRVEFARLGKSYVFEDSTCEFESNCHLAPFQRKRLTNENCTESDQRSGGPAGPVTRERSCRATARLARCDQRAPRCPGASELGAQSRVGGTTRSPGRVPATVVHRRSWRRRATTAHASHSLAAQRWSRPRGG